MLYAALAVFVPVAWGLAVVFVTKRLERVVGRRLSRDSHPPADYDI